jgi:hypothetical protein
VHVPLFLPMDWPHPARGLPLAIASTQTLHYGINTNSAQKPFMRKNTINDIPWHYGINTIKLYHGM